ncbi:type I secretion system permease/ATPase [Congregibacter litoralis]|uniref:Type I secretion system ATPase, LssB family n=1 Tax=Congregibacter litoralis KT71 TaxID=314285 RepID=A4A582_9GAMM|nr:type I secretion system permease/ATPase [Congregibacter litoralis]EAQ98953.1 type I secretion system ATPase, LssB family [Congregibacter litoralis KT71]
MTTPQHDPLVDCLLYVARFHQLAATAESLTAALPVGHDGLTPDLLLRSADRAGLNARLAHIDLRKIPDAVAPAVVLLEDSACVYLGANANGAARVVYPHAIDTEVTETFEALSAKATGHVLLARPRFKIDNRVDDTAMQSDEGHWFWSAIRAHSPVYRDVLFAAFFINVFALALPLFTMNVYDRVVPNAAFETLWVLAAGMFVVLIGDVILRTLRNYFIDLASRRVDIDLSAKIMEQALGMRMEHRPASVGSFAVNLRSFETLRDFIASATINSVIDLPFALLFFVVIGWIAWPVLIPVLAGIVLLVGFALFMRPRLQRLTESAYQAGAMRNATLIESLTGLETLKAMGAESVMQRKWEDSTRFLAGVGVSSKLASSSVTQATTWCQQIITVSVIITGVYLISVGELTMGGLIACTMLAGRSVAPFGQLAGLITQYHNARIALASLDAMFDAPVDHRRDGAYLSRESFDGGIEFKDVAFSYPAAETVSLRGVSFTVKPGEHVAVLGRVGSGKTTLQKLAMGLYRPTEGEVLIDGIDLRQLDPREYRQAIGYVPQDVTLFHGNLRDNLSLAHRGLTDAALLKAVERAGLAEFVNRHPSGFDMAISERGDSVSGGQRRCIGLARALVHEPRILLLDEPTGSMDNSTEKVVIDNLKTFIEGRTMIVVTHRNALLELVDRIIVVDSGRIVADGPKDSVVAALQQGRIGKAQ